MKDNFAVNKKIRLSIYSLPQIIYVKYSILAWFLIVLINGLSISFIYLLWNARDIIPEELLSFLIFLVFIILTIYVDTDVLHAIMKKQFIEISDKSIRVKKLTSDRSFDWSEIKSIEEMYSIKFHILIGVKLKK
ncbi:hypothetical protein JOC70_002208 [Clostridium pascui]|uniref:hypothetical protein n=1 Tax=Clostridium pascui TaxID=46609 RepID=UPI00195EBDF1|nr:hypothetical protein [Clostridium pascui]MBM7870714.1 hypothetical protein [Clostridium pascui]